MMSQPTPMGLTILGSTGSIGVSTLDVVARHPQRYRIHALTANRDVEGLAQQCLEYRPAYAVMADAGAAQQLQEKLQSQAAEIQVLCGVDGLVQVAGMPEVDAVMAAIVGAAGLLPTLEAARKGKRVLLANKEALVMSGGLFMNEIRTSGAVLLPIDSEHNAIYQCMPPAFTTGQAPGSVERILLTASGGPFRNLPLEQLSGVTPEQACDHPNWDMGRKISVDSATMMNKGLEVIEACWLFGLDASDIQVVLHPQSVIHSMVQYVDGSVLAQLGNPDMRTPIAYGLAWPERITSGVQALDLFAVARLDFEAPDVARFPCLRLAYEAWRRGGTAATILNAANELAVDAFLAGQLPFTGIPSLIEECLGHCTLQPADDLHVILAADAQARDYAREKLSAYTRRVS